MSGASTPQADRMRRALARIDALEAELASLRRGGSAAVGVLGMGLRLPGGVGSASGFWDVLVSAGAVTAGGSVHAVRGGWLDRVDTFDAGFWGISPREAAAMDPQQRLLLECAWEALEDAGVTPKAICNTPTGIYVGLTP